MLCLWALSGLAGCSTLLPRARVEESPRFASFAAARDALEQTQPGSTTTAQLRELGFDIAGRGSVEQVPYPQWLHRLLLPQLPLDRLDAGLRDCMTPQSPCRAYVFRFADVRHERLGSFWLDFLNFQRVTRTSGWKFEAVLLVRDDVLMFRNHGGEEHVESTDKRVNPLGPLQGIGERAVRGGT